MFCKLNKDRSVEADLLLAIAKEIVYQEKNGCLPLIQRGNIDWSRFKADAKTIYSAGIHRSYLNRFHDIGSGEEDASTFENKKYVFGVSAAAALYNRAALEEIKQNGEYFDEDFFYFFEDVDISWRLQRKGWRILYTPKAECYHGGGRSRNKDKISQYYCFRNRYLLLLKNESPLGLVKLIFVFLFYDLWRNLFMLVVNPRYLLKGAWEVMRLAPKMLSKR